jgi:hypothetical protein
VVSNLAPPPALLSRAMSLQSLSVATGSTVDGAPQSAAGGASAPAPGVDTAPTMSALPLVLAYPTPYLPYACGIPGVSVQTQAVTPAASGTLSSLTSLGSGYVDAGLTPSLLTVSPLSPASGSLHSDGAVVSAFAGAGTHQPPLCLC